MEGGVLVDSPSVYLWLSSIYLRCHLNIWKLLAFILYGAMVEVLKKRKADLLNLLV